MNTKRHSVTEEIKTAFRELMTEKPFIDITITDVVNRAGVARASFYRNYTSTRELLDSVLEDFFSEFLNNALPVLSSQNERDWRAFLFRFIYFAEDKQSRIILSQNSNISMFLIKMSDFAHGLSESFRYESIKDKYSISTRLAVMNSVVMRWIDDGKKETPEELVDYLMSFILTI